MRNTREAGTLKNTFAALVAVRQMMLLRPTIFDCAVFFNVPAFLVFLMLVHRIFRWASRSLDVTRSDFMVANMFAAEAMMLVLLLFPSPQTLSTRVTTDN